MKMRLLLGALSILALSVTPVFAEESLEERVKRLEEALQKAQERESRGVPAESSQPKQYPVPTGPMTDIRVGRPGEEKTSLGFGSTGSGKLIYAKPFLSMPKATLGGYADVMYNILSRQNLDNPSRNSFGQQRLVPFIFADITDRVKFATEIEIERGGTNSPQGDGTIQVEFAQLDYLIDERINLRGGILLMPVGKFNLLHDSPLNDLVDRPMVSRLIIPSTWFEAGAGIYGTFYPSALSKIDYELYAVNGMTQTAGAVTDLGIRGARGSVSRDRDDSKAIVGRLAFSPMLGIEIAGSGYHGQYKPSTATVGSGNIDIFAVDWTLQRGPFELIGEAAWTRISNNNATGVAGNAIGPAGMFGYYVQGNYHFMPEILKRLAPSHFSDASTFTATVRWEQIDTDTDNRTVGGANTLGNRRELDRLTVGLNFRPVEDMVFKINWQHNAQNGAVGLTPAGDLGTASSPMDGDGFLFQAATYF
ncbi:MAG: hypothetical protein OEV27_08860 [Nitrospira sp.]|nr:hypothetical protein [Nitrospira sp.]MDH4251286.1 hypothetical protein [Nitrospira sp.]MDH4344185.1 hypothetical protein [Nitrospira sp.]MDH5336810.1 hypothetical protein [Nitrospira sp.]